MDVVTSYLESGTTVSNASYPFRGVSSYHVYVMFPDHVECLLYVM